MHLKIVLCLLTIALLLGILTVTPAQAGQQGALLGRVYAVDNARIGELIDKAKNGLCRLCGK
ncbi:MAG: hypothetical protein E7618_03640 [Ruminococcaceae bacterium]|nr:hypothetical protein [Oscillospiraceae bacterium]